MAQSEEFIFPGWEVTRKLGEGSFGGVYEIRRTLPGGRVEKCALKRLTVPRDSEEIRELYAQSFSKDSITAHYKGRMEELVNEYGIMQSLSGCPNIVNCHDIQYVQHDDGIGWDIYIRMELLYPLKKVLGSSYSEDMACNLGIQLCNALTACHGENIIHRDIKPENILVSGKGAFKLGDFGIAKVSEKTGTGTMTGTYGYMAPEVANHQHYGASVDIYSLGMVLYWMMNRRTLPFLPLPPSIPTGAQRQQAQDRRLSGEHLPPPVDGSEALKKIVLKACAFAPAERYRSAEEMQAALQSCMGTPAAQEQSAPEQKPATITPPAPISEPTVIDTPTELEREPAVHANAPQRAQQVPQQRGQMPKKEAPEKKSPKKKQKQPVIYHVMVTAIIVALLLASCGVGIVISSYSKRSETANVQTLEPTQAQETEATTETAAQIPVTVPRTVPTEPPTEAPTEIPTTVPTAAPTEAPTEAPAIKANSRVLENKTVLIDSLSGDSPSLVQEIMRKDVKTITFLNSLDTAPADAEDISEAADGSVLGWATGSKGNYDLYIAADGSVVAPENCSGLFSNYTNLEKIDFNGCFDTSQAKNMSDMFYGCGKLLSFDLSGFDTSKVISMRRMFCGCNHLTSLDVRSFNTSQVTDMSGMFMYCLSLERLELNNFDTSKVTDMGGMFAMCESLRSLDVGSFNTSRVTRMISMFGACQSLTDLNLSGFDTSEVTNMDSMFFYCNLTNLNLGRFDTSSVVSYKDFMVEGTHYHGKPWEQLFAVEEPTEASAKSPTAETNPGVLREDNYLSTSSTVFEQYIQRKDVVAITFLNSLETAPEDAWDLSQAGDASVLGWINWTSGYYCNLYIAANGSVIAPQNCSKLFANYSSLETINFNSCFDTSRVTDMSYMFYSCSSLTGLDLSSFKTPRVTDMNHMFSLCVNLTNLNVGSFDTSKVTNMRGMFYTCSNLPDLDLSSFDTSNVTNMSLMFNNCRSLSTLNCGRFDTSKVTSYDFFMNSGKTYNGKPWEDLFTATKQEVSQEQASLQSYQAAQQLMNDGKYMQAMWAFEKLNYRDSQEKAREARDCFIASQRAPLSAGNLYTVGLRSDGTVVAVGSNSTGQCNIGSWSNIVDISAGYSHTVGLCSDGTVVAVGGNIFDGCNTASWTNIVAVSAGDPHTVGLRSDGTVVATGSNGNGQCNTASWRNIVAVSAGNFHTVALRSDGTVVATGSNGDGQCDTGSWTNIVAVSAKGSHTVGLRSDGTVVAIGENYYGQCNTSSWTDIVAISAGHSHTVGLRSDGTMVATGLNIDGQCNVSSWKSIVAISAGDAHTVGLRSDGTVVATGANGYGQSDVGSWRNISTAQAAPTKKR